MNECDQRPERERIEYADELSAEEESLVAIVGPKLVDPNSPKIGRRKKKLEHGRK